MNPRTKGPQAKREKSEVTTWAILLYFNVVFATAEPLVIKLQGEGRHRDLQYRKQVLVPKALFKPKKASGRSRLICLLKVRQYSYCNFVRSILSSINVNRRLILINSSSPTASFAAGHTVNQSHHVSLPGKALIR